MGRRDRKEPAKRVVKLDEGEPSVWSTGLVFATLILLTALMFVLAHKVVTSQNPSSETNSEIRARR